MSSGTYKQRIAQNNAKIEELIELVKTKGSGGSDEWQPNPTWWDIEKILAEDTRDYKYKTIILLRADDVVEETISYNSNTSTLYVTSDGASYEGGTVTHTWDLTKDKPCIVDGKEAYRTRYVIVYNNYANSFKLRGTKALYVISNGNLDINSGYNILLEGIKATGKPSGTTFNYQLQNNRSLKYAQINLEGINNFYQTFGGDVSLKNLPIIDLSTAKNVSYMFNGCSSLCKPINFDYDTSLIETFDYMLKGCPLIPSIKLNTINGKSFTDMCSGNYCLEEIEIDIRNATSVRTMLNNCEKLTNAKISNIKISLQIGSGTNWGHHLTLDSLLYTIKELHDNTNGTSTLTLTVGSANLTKLANVYVKLIDITDEMRAEDEFIDLKKPFVVCESTDEGAMLITEYVTGKNWQLA